MRLVSPFFLTNRCEFDSTLWGGVGWGGGGVTCRKRWCERERESPYQDSLVDNIL